MAKILVTGGAGFIGSHIAVELLAAGYEVVIVDNFCNSSPAALRGIAAIAGRAPAFLELDLCAAEPVAALFAEHQDIDAVVHLAALKAVGESVEEPLLYYRNNLISTLNLLTSMEAHAVHKFIYSSSACVYGQPQYLPIDEQHPITTETNPYGRTKSMAEEMLQHICQARSEFTAISLRYFNPIGAHPSALIGENPKGVPANLTPYLNQVAAGHLPHLRIFGNDYDTIDGTGVRDYIHILDLADAHLRALDRLLAAENDANYEVYNLGTGQGSSVLEMVKMFEEVSGVKVPFEIYPRRAGDFATVYNEVKLAREKLGWAAQRTVREALLDGWNWEKKLRGI